MPDAADTLTPPEPKLKRLRTMGAALWEDMDRYKSTWGTIGEFFSPWRNACLTNDDRSAVRRAQRIINSAATLAYNAFCAGMLAGTCSPSQRWFKVTVQDVDESDEQANLFFEAAERKAYDKIARTNAYRSLALMMGDQGLYGPGAMLTVHDNGNDPFRCFVYSIGTYALGIDDRGVVDTFYREFEYSAQQMRSKFGTKVLSSSVKDALRNDDRKSKFVVCHAIYPNDEYREKASVPKFKKWAECYFEKAADEGKAGDGVPLKEGGYDSFPVQAPRWRPGDERSPYGVGIGIELLPDVIQLQGIERSTSNAIENEVDPAVTAPTALAGAYISRRPGKVTVVDVMQGQQGVERLFESNLNLQHVEVLTQKIIARINEGLFKDLWRLFTDPNRELPGTAFLAKRMFDEIATNLLPAMEQQNDELLVPFLDRVFELMTEAGELPPVPASLRGKPLKFEFISPLAEAQRAMKVGGIQAFLAVASQMVVAFPECKNVVDAVQTLRELGDGFSIPAKMLRSDDEIAELDDAEAQAMEAQQQLNAIPPLAGAAKDLGATPMGQGSALDQLVGASA